MTAEMNPKSSADYQQARRELVSFLGHLKRRPRVLVVDDFEDDMYFITKILAQFPCDVTECRTGHQAIDLILEREFDLVLLDMKLNGTSGIDVLKSCRGPRPNTKFVIVTGADDGPMVQEASQLGLLICIPKPVIKEDLEQVFGALRL